MLLTAGVWLPLTVGEQNRGGEGSHTPLFGLRSTAGRGMLSVEPVTSACSCLSGGPLVQVRCCPMSVRSAMGLVVSSWYSASTLTSHTSWAVPLTMLSTVSIAVNIEWSWLL